MRMEERQTHLVTSCHEYSIEDNSGECAFNILFLLAWKVGWVWMLDVSICLQRCGWVTNGSFDWKIEIC